MSELRDECYKCLNNQNCISGADYGSFYCMTRRKFKMPEQEDDSVYATKFAVMQKQINEKDKRIKELEEELYSANKIVEEYLDGIPKQKIKEKINENSNMIREIEEKIKKEENSGDICEEYLSDLYKEKSLVERDILTLQELLQEEDK